MTTLSTAQRLVARSRRPAVAPAVAAVAVEWDGDRPRAPGATVLTAPAPAVDARSEGTTTASHRPPAPAAPPAGAGTTAVVAAPASGPAGATGSVPPLMPAAPEVAAPRGGLGAGQSTWSRRPGSAAPPSAPDGAAAPAFGGPASSAAIAAGPAGPSRPAMAQRLELAAAARAPGAGAPETAVGTPTRTAPPVFEGAPASRTRPASTGPAPGVDRGAGGAQAVRAVDPPPARRVADRVPAPSPAAASPPVPPQVVIGSIEVVSAGPPRPAPDPLARLADRRRHARRRWGGGR